MDLMMPIMDGLEATAKIKNLIAEKIIKFNIKIIIVTAFTSNAEKQKCK